MSEIKGFTKEIIQSFGKETFVKLTLGDYKGDEKTLKKLLVRPLVIKRKKALSFVYRHQTNDITKNFPPEEAWLLLSQLIGESGFRYGHLSTTDFDVKLSYQKKSGFSLRQEAASTTQKPSLSHDREKNRKIQSVGKPYLQELRITDSAGKVYKNAQDKFRQINHYIEILSGLLQRLPSSDSKHIVDMGSGKGYLTFALYDYLLNQLKVNAQLTGVEFREDLVKLCNRIAKSSGFEQLHFVEGTIQEYAPKEALDVLIALHACDTATDDAIAKGITHQAELIVVAPCCHKQVRREMEKGKPADELEFLLQHGIFMERQAEMATDGLRALILEYFGYTTRVFDFISDAHTPKNVLIVAEKRATEDSDRSQLLRKIEQAKQHFGIGQHYLETLLEL